MDDYVGADDGGPGVSNQDGERSTDTSALHEALRKERVARKAAEKLAKAAGDELERVTAERDGVKAALDGLRKPPDPLRQRLLEAKVREAARAAGVHEVALGDVLVRVTAAGLKLADDGGECLDPDGSAVNLDDFVRGLRDGAPHLFPATGGGSGGTENSWRSPLHSGVMKRREYEAAVARGERVIPTKLIDD